MACLSIRLLGPLQVTADGKPVTGLRSDKARALLAYLAVEAERPHRREKLAGLLWPDYPERSARANLRRTLANLRQAIGDHQATPPFLHISRQTIQFNSDSDAWTDVTAFTNLLQAKGTSQQTIVRLEEAAALYRGPFLEGFSIGDSPAIEEWVLLNREQLHRLVMEALHRLAGCYEQRGEYERALQHAWRQVELDPWREKAHRQLMRLLALSGQRGAALAQYETCRRLLARELGVEPAQETTRLYEQIRNGELSVGVREPEGRRDLTVALPVFLTGEEPVEVERPVFVARERELGRMNEFLETALEGKGRVIFVTGGAGRGKTALMGEFARRAQEAHPDLLVATGNCNAYSGIGDPYLPFRDCMGMLTGDVEARWAAGTITRDHACRLWETLLSTVQMLVDRGPELVGAFVPAEELLARTAAAAPDGSDLLERLRELTQRRRAGPAVLEQSHLFEQYAHVLRGLATQRPLLIVLDDLQWADAASISLLFHLGRRIDGSRILIAGAYRPDEVALGRPSASSGQVPSASWRGELVEPSGQGEPHPLEKVLAEFKRHFGDVWVDLAEADEREGQRFVHAFLDTEPNRLGEDFREALHGRTGGHPLFTIELLRDMQERGDLVRDAGGRWVEGPSLTWDVLPARVEGVIEKRIGRLKTELREILAVASVEGEDFTAQVVARVQEIGERQLLRELSQELGKLHCLVRERGEVQVGRQRLSRYQFAHVLFQQHLYNSLSAGERRLLHGNIALVLEELYEGHTDEIAVQLAHHFQEEGVAEKAIEYLLQAGDQARLAYAHEEAIDSYKRALIFLKEQKDYERVARTLMKLGLTHHTVFDFRGARQAYEEGFALWQKVGEVQPAVPWQPAPHALRVAWRDPRTLDPTVAVVDYWSGVTQRVLFSGLVEESAEMEVVPDVARGWEVLERGRKYLFHLRDDVRWSDSTPVTAGDFEYAWKRVLDPATGAEEANLLYDVKGARAFHQGEVSEPDSVGVRALDEVTLAVELEKPTGYFLHLLAQNETCPVPRHVVERHGESWTEVGNIVTNGPFRLEAWQRGELMILSRNPGYHGQFGGNVQRVELTLIPSQEWAAQLEMYEADGLDIVGLYGPPPLEMARIRHAHPGEYVSAPQPATTFVGFDVRQPPFDDVRVRRAFVLATDRETLADVALRGFRFPATGGFIPPGIPGHSPGIGLAYDPDQARKLLAEAGYPGGRGIPVVEVLRVVGPVGLREYLPAQWRENLGIEIVWKQMAYGRFLDRLRREPPYIFVNGWTADYPDPDNFLRVAFPWNETGWQNEAYDRLVEEARRVMDQAERMKLYRQADRILVEEAVIVPLTYARYHLLVKPWVTKYPMSPTNAWFWKDVVIEPH